MSRHLLPALEAGYFNPFCSQAESHSSSVNSHITTANYDRPLSYLYLLPQVGIFEEVNTMIDTFQILTGDT